MHRFFLPVEVFEADTIHFPSDTARQMTRVLRLRSGEQVIVLDGSGREALVELTRVEGEMIQGRVRERRQNQAELPVHISLFICLTQREKFEWILQKGSEVGINAFVPVISERSLVQSGEQKLQRWQRILREAAEQSGRGTLPQVAPAVTLEGAVRQVDQFDLCLAAWEEEKSLGLRRALVGLRAGARLALLVGPEGGLSAQEIRLARSSGWQTVSLGRRILRMETAALVAAALIAAYFEDCD